MDLMGNGNVVSFVGADGSNLNERAAKEAHNKAVKAAEDVIKEQTERALQQAKEVREKASQLDVVPINQYVLVKPYAKNPFELMDITESGIIIPEYSGIFKNPDTGEMDKEENIMVVADVIEVSPSNKYVKVGDMVYYKRPQEVPLPFLRQGFKCVAEQAIVAVINENLKERFKDFNG